MNAHSDAAVNDPAYIRTVRGRSLADHRYTELAGILKGLRIARARDMGLRYLARWIESCEEIHDRYPIEHFRELLAPCLDPSWHEAHRDCIQGIRRGLDRIQGTVLDHNQGLRLAPDAQYSHPLPTIEFMNRRFVFTGGFSLCARFLAEQATHSLGGLIRSRPALCTDWLVVGSWAHPGWITSTKGRKLEQVEQWIDEDRTQCKIVSEKTWASAVRTLGRAALQSPDKTPSHQPLTPVL